MSNLVFVNISAWESDQVADWLRGLDDVIIPYVHYFLNRSVTGKQLLFLGHHDLQKLGVTKLGHQELIMEAIELLALLHHELESENVQSQALKLGCKASSLYNQVKAMDCDVISINGNSDVPVHVKFPLYILTAVSDIVSSVKSLASWLDRPPFHASDSYIKKRNILVKQGMDLIATAQGDNTDTSQEHIMDVCQTIADMCEKLVRQIKDPLIIQPATLEIATIKKKPDDELGMHIQSSYNGIHLIEGIKEDSPAETCGKIEVGDEVIQVNYQTVVGWQLKKLVSVLKGNQKEVTLTLKKRPRHATNSHGHKRKGSKNHSTFPKSLKRNSRKGSGKSRSPLQDFLLPPPSEPFSESCRDNDTDNELDTDNDVFQGDADSLDYQLDAKHRRATVSGGSPTLKRPSIKISELTGAGRPKSHTITVSSPSSESETLSLGSPNSGIGSPEVEVKITKPEGSRSSSKDSTPVTSPLRLSPSTERKIEAKIRAYESPKNTDSPKKQVPSLRHTPKTVDSPKATDSPKRRRNAESTASTILPGDEKGSPQLVRVTRINSFRRAEMAEQERREREDHFPDVTSEFGKDGRPVSAGSTSSSGTTSYTVNIVGGVAQRVPVTPNKNNNLPGDQQSPSMLLRKKNIRKLGANRRISCKDLGHGDCQGWLWKKREGHGAVLSGKWMKRWFILKSQNLYYYKDPEDDKAQGVIHLPGFQVSPAKEIKSKKFAFKAHHTGTTFYFASERQDDMGKWMNKMGLAAIVYDTSHLKTTAGFTKPDPSPGSHDSTGYYSESDDESDSPGKSSPSNPSHQGSTEDITDQLASVLREIQDADLGLDGSNRRKRRTSTLSPAGDIPEAVGPNLTEVSYGRKLSSLQRTLKAKEQELIAIEGLLSTTQMSSGTLKLFCDLHPGVVEQLHGELHDSSSSQSDEEAAACSEA